MQKWFKILLLCIIISFNAKSQGLPTGLPITNSNGWIEYGYVQPDSSGFIAPRDTNWLPRKKGYTVYWQNNGVDSCLWVYNGKLVGKKWDEFCGGSGGGGGSLIGSTSGAESNPPSLATTETWLGTYADSMGTASKTNTTFLGLGAGKNATNANTSVFIGSSEFGGTGYEATNANGSVFAGWRSGNKATNAQYGTFLGQSSGDSAINAIGATFLGESAGYRAVNAEQATFIGHDAGYLDQVNTVIGAQAADWSILIGSFTNTGSNLFNNHKNSILIGSNDQNTAQNQFKISGGVTQFNMRNVNYTMPNALGGIGTVLTDIGGGVLDWIPFTGGASINPTRLISVDSIGIAGTDLTIYQPVVYHIEGFTEDFSIDNDSTFNIVTADSGFFKSFSIYADSFRLYHIQYSVEDTIQTEPPSIPEKTVLVTTGIIIGGLVELPPPAIVSPAWLITGNAGLDTTNFVGNKDNVPLIFKVNGYKSGIIDNQLQNTTLGYQSGRQIITGGTRNTLVGYQAGDSITTGNGNATLGNGTLHKNILGSANVAIGTFALYNNKTNLNTAMGCQAGVWTTTGGSNTFIGGFAGTNNTTGIENVFMGANTGIGNITGRGNTGLGTWVFGQINGNFNTAVGHKAMQVTTTGVNNVAVGTDALLGNTTGSWNTGLGGFALPINTTGSWNIGIGDTSLRANTTGSRNISIGSQSGSVGATGSFNTYIGYLARAATTSTFSSMALGMNAVAGSNQLTLSDSIKTLKFGGLPTGAGYVLTDVLGNHVLSMQPSGGGGGGGGGLNIYNSDSTLKSNRTVTMENKFIQFNSTSTSSGFFANIDETESGGGLGVTSNQSYLKKSDGAQLLIGNANNQTNYDIGIESIDSIRLLGALHTLAYDKQTSDTSELDQVAINRHTGAITRYTGGFGDSGGGVNIYNSDSTLSGDRTVNGGNHVMAFTNTNNFQASSNNGIDLVSNGGVSAGYIDLTLPDLALLGLFSTGLVFQDASNNPVWQFKTNGSLEIEANTPIYAGTEGQVLTSHGTGHPFKWEDAAGGVSQGTLDDSMLVIRDSLTDMRNSLCAVPTLQQTVIASPLLTVPNTITSSASLTIDMQDSTFLIKNALGDILNLRRTGGVEINSYNGNDIVLTSNGFIVMATSGGTVNVTPSGDLSFPAGSINQDGSCNFSNGNITFTTTGSLTTNDIDNYGSDVSGSFTGLSKINKDYADSIFAKGSIINNSLAQTSAITVYTLTTPNDGTNRHYQVGGDLNITAVTADVIEFRVTFTDIHGTSTTKTFFQQGLTTAGLNSVTYAGYSPIDIYVQANTTITVATVLTTGIGSITYDVSSTVQQLTP